jgi:hypothetical protein
MSTKKVKQSFGLKSNFKIVLKKIKVDRLEKERKERMKEKRKRKNVIQNHSWFVVVISVGRKSICHVTRYSENQPTLSLSFFLLFLFMFVCL